MPASLALCLGLLFSGTWTLQQLAPPKPFRTYSDLVTLLIARGMEVPDPQRAERKLAQIGYYRLSGYWFPARDFVRDNQQQVVLCNVTNKPLRQSQFQAGTSFDDAVALYLFDKRLRQLMLDAIERIEIHLRTVIAHEVGYHNPMAYTDVQFIQPKQAKPWTDASGKQRNTWAEWLLRQQGLVNRSQEDCIEWHRKAHKAIPFWVAVEAWDFGTLSKYFEILKGNHQNRIAGRLGIQDTKALTRWLREINTLRNRCAHHTRIWNQVSANPLPVIAGPYFQTLALDHKALTRLYGLTSIIWHLVQCIGPSSTWIQQLADIIDSKPSLPGCPYAALGLPDETGFPRKLFGIA